MNRRIDILLVSKKHNFLRNFNVSIDLAIAVLIIFCVITAVSVFLFVRNSQASYTEIRISQAEEQNRALLQRLDEIKLKLDDFRARLSTNISQDNRQRSFLQVAQIHPDVWSMGIGGNKPKLPSTSISNRTEAVLDDIYRSFDILNGQCELRNNSLRELEGEINKNMNLWAHIPSINPIPGTRIGSGFGYRVDPITKSVRMHEGVDLGSPTGTPIMASADGMVTYSNWNMGYGFVIDINHGYGFESRYAHCSRLLVQTGEFVKRGQVIALVGATGRTTCSHLHYEVQVSEVKINPANYIDFTNIVCD